MSDEIKPVPTEAESLAAQNAEMVGRLNAEFQEQVDGTALAHMKVDLLASLLLTQPMMEVYNLHWQRTLNAALENALSGATQRKLTAGVNTSAEANAAAEKLLTK